MSQTEKACNDEKYDPTSTLKCSPPSDRVQSFHPLSAKLTWVNVLEKIRIKISCNLVSK